MLLSTHLNVVTDASLLASMAGMNDSTGERSYSGQAKQNRDQPTRPEDGPMTGSTKRARRRRSTVAPAWETGDPSATSPGDETSATIQPSSMSPTAGAELMDTKPK